jgi:predicted HAD superfamily phosphohydrolase YqeG
MSPFTIACSRLAEAIGWNSILSSAKPSEAAIQRAMSTSKPLRSLVTGSR